MLISPTTPGWSLSETKKVLLTKWNNPNINLWPVQGSAPEGWVALGETLPHLAIHAENLDTLGTVNYTDSLKVSTTITPMSPPHPQRLGNDTISFYIEPSLDPLVPHKLTLYRMNASFYRHKITELKLKKVPYMHSFSVTSTKAILFAYPFHYDWLDAPLGAYVEHFLKWDRLAKTVIYVIDLASGDVQTFQTDPMFCFHHVNAWDDPEAEGGCVVDALCYDTEHATTILSKWDVTHDAPPDKIGAFLRRYTIPSSAGTSSSSSKLGEVPWDLLSTTQFELPRINDNFHLNSSYCVVYGWTCTGLVRVDICANSTLHWPARRPNQYPSEAVFVPRSAYSVEEDGVLVAVVYDGENSISYLTVLDSNTLAELANATSPIFTPFSIHGAWNPSAEPGLL